MTTSHLINYLTKYFSAGPIGQFEGETVDIIPHLFDKFGVTVKNEGNLWLYKYDMLAAKFSFPLTHECRGTIVKYDNGIWNIISRPWHKFFNLSEGYCPYFNVQTFPSNNSLSLVEKADGTAIQLYFDGVKWRISTLGTITPFKVGDYDITFDELFLKCINVSLDDLTKDLIPGYTYLFELCANENRIVTKYSTNRVYILSVVDQYGIYHDVSPVNEKFPNILIPEKKFLYELNISNKEQLVKYVEDVSSIDTTDAMYREGYVLYDGLKPVGKIKNIRYLSLHSFSGGDTAHGRNCVIEAYFAGSLDDVYSTLNDTLVEFADELKAKVTSMTVDTMEVSSKMRGMAFDTQKDYALYVQKNIPKHLSAFFFQNKEKVLSENISDAFTDWLRMNYQKFEAIWKNKI